MSRSTGTTGRVSRFTIRFLAIGLLLLSTVGSTIVGGERGHQPPSQADAAVAVPPAVDGEQSALRRLVEVAERTDRSIREAVTKAEQRASRAQGPEESPPPEPSSTSDSSGSSEDSGESAGSVPESCNQYSGNRAIGCALLLDNGFSLDQMSCLDSLWTKESGWNERAQNPSSGAYGIPQALPGDKMASHGDDWRTNPATQISWGLDYIAGRYGTPCGAWSHSQANGWY
ncbi:MAG TPA: transglycosylase SLT domain-containing protein [Natronosporangium sp.]